jgi:hypothetical protein
METSTSILTHKMDGYPLRKNMMTFSCQRHNELAQNSIFFLVLFLCYSIVTFLYLNNIGNFPTLLAWKQNWNEKSILGKFVSPWAGESHHIFFKESNHLFCGSNFKFPFDKMRYSSEQWHQSQLWDIFKPWMISFFR